MLRYTCRLVFLISLTLFQGVSVMADSTSDIAARNKAMVLDRFNAWKAGTGSPFELLAETATWTIVGHSVVAKTYKRDDFLNEVIKPFNARMKEGLKPYIREISADGDSVIIFFDGRALARDGKPYANTYAWFFRMTDGKVVEATAFFDSIEFNDLWQRVQPG